MHIAKISKVNSITQFLYRFFKLGNIMTNDVIIKIINLDINNIRYF